MRAETLALEQVGMTKAEAKTYLVLVELGPSQAVNVVTKTGLHRRTVYDSIERLIEKGLVSYIKYNNIRHYKAVNPKQLQEILKEKEENLNEVMPQLTALYNSTEEKKETLFFKGKQAIKSVFNDQIIDGKEILVMGASTKAPDVLKYYFPHFDSERIKKKIKVKIIFDESARRRTYVKKIPNAEIRYLPKEFATPAATNVYGDKISIVLWGDDPIAILIKQKEIAETYRKFFALMWSIAKE